jgi:hypothetical protein
VRPRLVLAAPLTPEATARAVLRLADRDGHTQAAFGLEGMLACWYAPMTTWLFAAPSTGHGILLAPGTEYWLLSGAPQNPNEAVNLLRSAEDARNASIPHVIFFSDACRSTVPGAPLNGVVGGSIFPIARLPHRVAK